MMNDLGYLEYTRARSRFWLRIYEEATDTSILTNDVSRKLMNYFWPQFSEFSPTGWKETQSSNYRLWIPDNRMDWSDYERLKEWAEHTNSCIWLGTNKHTNSFFDGDELDFCVAYDWNFDVDAGVRTPTGEAEYQLKYQFPKGKVAEIDRKKYAKLLKNAINCCVECLPFDFGDFVVTTIPATIEKQNKLSWTLAEYVSKRLNIPFVKLTLAKDKPQIKEQSMANKIQIWRNIYSDDGMLALSEEVLNRISEGNVLIVDDLFQSGASIWCLSEFLKDRLDAGIVVAATSVKALKDGDNK